MLKNLYYVFLPMRRNVVLRKRRMTAKNTAKRHTSIFFGNALSFEYRKARREKNPGGGMLLLNA